MNAVTPTIAATALPPGIAALIPDGVHFGLAEDAYRQDPALGSSDMKTLSWSAADYWWNSVWNPAREERTETPSLVLGTALHRFVLEGRARFEAEYGPTDHNGSTREGKAERAHLDAAERIPLKRADYDRVLASGTMIRANEHLSSAFEGGQPEVSVFWTAKGIRKKARIDYLKPRANVDLKSVANQMHLRFPEACRKAIATYGYHVQGAHYLEARMAMREMVEAGQVFDGPDAAWVRSCVAADTYAHVLLFWQSVGAPLTHGCTLSIGNPILEVGQQQIAQAEAAYQFFVERFGFGLPWVLAEPLSELAIEDMPGWFGR